jgi:hypothetical protein
MSLTFLSAAGKPFSPSDSLKISSAILDSFNLMNHVNFRSLQVTTSSNNFGTVTASGPARNIQGGLRLTF